ncbi:MAG TPA: hypothetical protein VLL72_09890 [Kiloniellales bacterium]|nr:hypothetical protein [Kiloniellales bacterium]
MMGYGPGDRVWSMFGQQLGLLFGSGERRPEVKVGDVFKAIRDGNIVETAKVLDVAPDSMGVPHVHYEVSIQRANQESYEEKRTLGLSSFAERFRKTVPA